MTEPSQKTIEGIVSVGDVIAGKYVVERVLGAGGMGVVVAATHTQLEQRVAIKLLLPSVLSNQQVVERFQREARAAAKIKSEHVVRVIDVGALDTGLPYIVMEFLDGRDLGDLLSRRGVLPIPLAIDYVLEACEALAEAHAAGIVHRDLKPANIFLARKADDSESVKVLDFGISKTLAPEALQSNPSLTKTTDVFGSPTYMSPEQLKASRDVDTRADIWALGVILHELLAGAPPFKGGTVAEIFGNILYKAAPGLRESRKDAPPELERILLKCVQKDPAHRFQSVAELAEALTPFGSTTARDSSARISRVLKSSGQRGKIPSGRHSQPGFETGPGAAAAASLVPDARDRDHHPDIDRAPSAGGATATSWGHIQPTPKGSPVGRYALVGIGAIAAAATGAFLVLKIMSPPAPGPAGPGPAGPTAEPRPAMTIPAPPEVVVSAARTAGPGASAATSAVPIVTPAGTGTAKLTGKLAPSAAPSLAPTAPAPTAAPTTKPAAPTGTSDDSEFGGRR